MAIIDDKLMKQTTNTVLMVRPVHFEFNAQTAVDNEFQQQILGETVHTTANLEFEKAVSILRSEGVTVLVLEAETGDTQGLIKTPDAVFPNNWFGTNPNGKLIIYTMATENRRAEVRRLPDVIQLLTENGYMFDREPLVMQKELSAIAPSQSFAEDILEGTGALVIDHLDGVAYAAKSVRCHPSAMKRMVQVPSFHCSKFVMFQTRSSTGKEFYHTNVMLSIGTRWAVVCSECIVEDVDEENREICLPRSKVLESLRQGGRTVIEISLEQAERSFCANILEVRGGASGTEPRIVMSQSAFDGFTEEQRQLLGQFGKLVAVPIGGAIEPVGGGSSRCMLAEIFLPRQQQQSS